MSTTDPTQADEWTQPSEWMQPNEWTEATAVDETTAPDSETTGAYFDQSLRQPADEPAAYTNTELGPAAKPFGDVLRDKRFWMTAPVLLIALAATVYFLIVGAKKPAKPLINQVNATIPSAQTDSVPRSKLELQAAGQRTDLTHQSSVNGMQTGLTTGPGAGTTPAGLPATLDPYLYKQPLPAVPQAADPELAAMDSLYARPAPARPRSSNRPRPLSRGRFVPGYADTSLPDELDEESPRAGSSQTDDRQRLLTLLAEYKRDKEAKAAVARDRERPRKAGPGAVVSSLGDEDRRRLNGFYGLYSADPKGSQEAALSDDLGTIRAVIYQNQQITDGGRVQLRLLEPVTVRGLRIPANTLIYGVGSFGAERVTIGITSLQYDGRIFPIKLAVHDMDGMPGVYVPNVLAAQEGKHLLSQAVGGANYNLSGSGTTNAKAAATLAGLAAAQAGLSGARGVLQRKIAQQKATLKGNYYVLLK